MNNLEDLIINELSTQIATAIDMQVFSDLKKTSMIELIINFYTKNPKEFIHKCAIYLSRFNTSEHDITEIFNTKINISNLKDYGLNLYAECFIDDSLGLIDFKPSNRRLNPHKFNLGIYEFIPVV